MEPTIIGFKEYSTDGSLKLVPWISWDEWDTVRVSLFSSSHVAVSSALNRITAWRSRGCLPLIVEITASLIEIQQKDPYFRVDTDNKDASESEEVLAMLYCMAIMRLVNGVVEKTRKKTEVSIGEAADTINIPRMLIDIRHECSHRDLPSLRLVRLASIKALDWLKSYYWEPQKKSIQSESDGASRIKKEIKYKLCELASFLQMKNAESTFPIKRKCGIKPFESFRGRYKFLSLTDRKSNSSKFLGSNKQISKAMKNLVRIYSSYSVEVVSVVVELLLKESGSSDFLCLDDDNHMQSIFDNWKSVITKLSNKEPEFLLTLIKTVHEMIETREANTRGSGVLAIPEDTAKGNHTDRLSDLFAWLVIILKGLKSRKKESHGVKETYPADTKLPKSTLVELLRKSLLVSPRNSQLKCTTLTFANMIGNNSLVEKLNRLFLLSASNPECYEENSSNIGSEIMFTQQEDDIKQAAEKIALLRSRKKQRKVTQRAAETNDGKGWNVVKEWKKCPIGMLSLGAASSGILPVLDIDEDHNQYLSENKEQGSLVLRNFKRKPDCDIEFLNETSGKKKRENEIDNRQDEKDELYSLGVQGKLMIGGVWKKVEEQELFAIAADIRVFV